jgi:hypothetical protein
MLTAGCRGSHWTAGGVCVVLVGIVLQYYRCLCWDSSWVMIDSKISVPLNKAVVLFLPLDIPTEFVYEYQRGSVCIVEPVDVGLGCLVEFLFA